MQSVLSSSPWYLKAFAFDVLCLKYSSQISTWLAPFLSSSPCFKCCPIGETLSDYEIATTSFRGSPYPPYPAYLLPYLLSSLDVHLLFIICLPQLLCKFHEGKDQVLYTIVSLERCLTWSRPLDTWKNKWMNE